MTTRSIIKFKFVSTCARSEVLRHENFRHISIVNIIVEATDRVMV